MIRLNENNVNAMYKQMKTLRLTEKRITFTKQILAQLTYVHRDQRHSGRVSCCRRGYVPIKQQHLWFPVIGQVSRCAV